MRPSRPSSLDAYVGLVSLAGAGSLAAILVRAEWASATDHPAATFFVAAFVVLGELWPVRVPRAHEEEHIAPSTAFAYGLLLLSGLAAAAAAAAIACVVADMVGRKPLWKSLFNASEYVLTLTATGTVLAALQARGWTSAAPVSPDAADLASIAVSALVWFCVNNTVIGVALALAQGLSVRAFLGQDLAFQAGVTAMQLALAPVVAAVAAASPWLVPLLAAPIVAVRWAAATSVEKEHQARHDSLTGLPNRAFFRQQAVDGLARARHLGEAAAVLLIDLDRFKEVNDTLGHHVGDQVLREVGPRLVEAVRTDDVVARLGGDEFVVLMPTVGSAPVATEVAERVVRALSAPVPLPDMSLDIAASVGIALFPTHGSDVDTLLRRADVAMYLAKAQRSGFEVYSDERDPYSPKRLALLGELRRAVEGDELVVHYQPKARLSDGCVTGVEALVRWRHPRHGLMLPDSFVPLAESTGLSRPLTLRVLDAALRQCRAWHAQDRALSVAVNLSVRNLHDGAFPDDVERLLWEHRVAPSCLQLEIPEGTLMADPERAMAVLRALAEMGVELALDDFGTGYSSLAYLQRLPVGVLKIDKTFVTNLAKDRNDQMIVRSTIDLARNLGLSTVAEGVESAEAWCTLVDLRCDVAQGYLLSPPLPAADLTAGLADGLGRPQRKPMGVGPGG